MTEICEFCDKAGHTAFTCNINEAYCKKGCCKLFRKNPTETYYKTSDERFKKQRAGVILTNSDNKILIVQSNGFKWGFPKGSIEPGETPEYTAVREVKEEVDIDVELEKRYVRIEKFFYFFSSIDKTPKINFSEEINGYGWISLDCLIESICFGYIKSNRYMLKYLQKIIKKVSCPKVKKILNNYGYILGFWEDIYWNGKCNSDKEPDVLTHIVFVVYKNKNRILIDEWYCIEKNDNPDQYIFKQTHVKNFNYFKN